MTNVTVFSFESQEIRTVELDGQTWWVAKDITDVLELSDVSMTIARLDEDEKGTSSIYTLGGNQDMLVVNESGLYSLILGSRKPHAKLFKKWITSEVIPSIRKTGSYSTPAAKAIPSASSVAQATKLLSQGVKHIAGMTHKEQQVAELDCIIKICQNPANALIIVGESLKNLREFYLQRQQNLKENLKESLNGNPEYLLDGITRRIWRKAIGSENQTISTRDAQRHFSSSKLNKAQVIEQFEIIQTAGLGFIKVSEDGRKTTLIALLNAVGGVCQGTR